MSDETTRDLQVTLIKQGTNEQLQNDILSIILDASMLSTHVSGGLTNQEIRKQLHAKKGGGRTNVAKGDINKTLHKMREDGVIGYIEDGRDKRWSCL
jgi:DNA-binding PadR family transcriptional regulator